MSDKSNKTKSKDNKLTSISISKKNYSRLRELGYCGQTFNSLMTQILDDIYATKEQEH